MLIDMLKENYISEDAPKDEIFKLMDKICKQEREFKELLSAEQDLKFSNLYFNYFIFI